MREERASQADTTMQPQNNRRSFLRRFAAGAGVAAAAATALPVAAKGEAMFGAEPFIGEISMFAGNFAPRGWAFCDGATLPISNNQALFSIIGTYYGGDGRTNFKLPDLKKQERAMGSVRYIIAVAGIFPSRP